MDEATLRPVQYIPQADLESVARSIEEGKVKLGGMQESLAIRLDQAQQQRLAWHPRGQCRDQGCADDDAQGIGGDRMRRAGDRHVRISGLQPMPVFPVGAKVWLDANGTDLHRYGLPHRRSSKDI